MSDPLRTDGSRAHADVASGPDRDAKIEQLLLVGLDHYFAGRYELAINVWTRALFLDRSHARARAYIERARSALAERQRESEELLQNGVAAFQRGEGDEARRLLQAAIDGGAPSEEALAVLDRLEPSRSDRAAGRLRRDRIARRAPTPPTRGGRRAIARRGSASPPSSCVAAAVVAVSGVAAPGTTHRLALDRRARQSRRAVRAGAGCVAPVARDAALPLPRRGETALLRARALAAGGHLRDALAALDAVRPTDPAAARCRSPARRHPAAAAGVDPVPLRRCAGSRER